jgi:hypothetical protein
MTLKEDRVHLLGDLYIFDHSTSSFALSSFKEGKAH